jgi:hypothetical protein
MESLNTTTTSANTLNYVAIQSIEDGVAILKNGTMRAVVLVSSINFDLKSSMEQEAIIGSYQNFLNSLDFPVQIVVSSRKLNMSSYLSLLSTAEKAQPNELLRIQTTEYRAFVKNLADVTNIMSKFFYIVVPFSPVENSNVGVLSKISSLVNPRGALKERGDLLETYKNQLWQRVDHVAAALEGTGLNFTALTTDELIELYYNAYNPSVYAQSGVKDVSQSDLAAQ